MKICGTKRNVYLRNGTICISNHPTAGSLIVLDLDTIKYSITGTHSCDIHKGEIIDGAFFSTEVSVEYHKLLIVSRNCYNWKRFNDIYS